MANHLSKSDILSFFNLEDENIEDISLTNRDNLFIATVSLCPDYPPCPSCGFERVKIKDYTTKKINHSIFTDRECLINYKARRYRCPICKRSYYEHNPFTFRSSKISALTVQNILRDLKNPSDTFASVARRYHVSPTTAASIFDKHVQMARLPLPEYIAWDECYAFQHPHYNSKYVFTILDLVTLDPVDIFPSRKKEHLERYFREIPIEERQGVKMIATDMYHEFRSIIRKMFPQAIHCVDHYHVSQELSRKVDSVRLRVMNSIEKYHKDTKSQTDEYYLLKKFNWLIFKREDTRAKDKQLLFDPNRKKVFNRKLQRYLNYYDIRNLIVAIHPDLKSAWIIKDDLVDFYNNNTYETADEALKELIQAFYNSGIEEMEAFGKTLRNWHKEIVNSFIVFKHSYTVDKETGQVVVSAQKMNTGVLENRNSILKAIKKNSNGYTNWERFRNRCLYILRKNAVPLLHPIEDK